MKKSYEFELSGVACLRDALRTGLIGVAADPEEHIGLTTVWCRLVQDVLLKIQSQMTTTNGWNEVGSLVFELNPNDDSPPNIAPLPEQWRNVSFVDKLVIEESDFTAESGLRIENADGESFTIVCSANPYQLAVEAPFCLGGFLPEYEIERYKRVPM